MADKDMTAMDRWRWWLSTFESTQPQELDCETVFGLLEVAVEAANAGQNVSQLFPGLAIHLDHCPGCRDLFDTLVALMKDEANPPLAAQT